MTPMPEENKPTQQMVPATLPKSVGRRIYNEHSTTEERQLQTQVEITSVLYSIRGWLMALVIIPIVIAALFVLDSALS